MNVFTDISQIDKNNNTILTIGTFDGVHLGHQSIIDKLAEYAKGSGGRSLLITFDPHPRQVVSANYDIKLLTTTAEKIDILSQTGLDDVLVMKFTPELSRLTSDEFFEQLIIDKIGLSRLIIGHDHRLGRNRDGDENKLKQLGEQYSFEVEPVLPVSVDGERISSTKIRHALEAGDVEKAASYTGRLYSFSGIVEKGAMRGRTLGFPTANVRVNDTNKLIPANGVYLVEFYLHEGGNRAEKHFGLMNIGLRPTFGDVMETVIEVYLLNFSRDIYGRDVTVSVVSRLREEKKFSSVDELIRQMEADKAEAEKRVHNF